MKGRIRFGDEAERYLTAQSIVERHELAIRFDQDLHRHIGRDGRNYSFYELGSTLPLVPFYALGASVAHFFPADDPNEIPLLFTGLFNPLIAALTCLVLYQLGRALDHSPRVALGVTLLFGLATIAFPYSKALEREPILALFLLLSVYTAFQYRKRGETKWLWRFGASVGYLFFAKIANLILFPFFAFYIAWTIFSIRKSALDFLLRVLAWASPIGTLVGIQAIYNYARYGNFMDIGLIGPTWGDPINFFNFANLPTVLPLILFSPAKSIFLYSPPLVLTLPGLITCFRSKRREALLVGSLIATLVFFYSLYSEGGIWWGPKYLVAITPLALVPVFSLLENSRFVWKRVWYGVALTTGLIGFGVQLAGVLVDERAYLDIMGKGIDLAGAIDFALHGAIDGLLIYVSPIGSVLQLNAYAWVLLGAILVFGSWMIANIRKENRAAVNSKGLNLALPSIFFLLQLTGLIVLVVENYSQVSIAQADTHYAAGNLFLADHKNCQAGYMYLTALDRRTQYTKDALAQLDLLLPRARGIALAGDELIDQFESSNHATIESDPIIALSEDGSLKITLPAGATADATALSISMPVHSNTTYELSGWLRTEAIAESGAAVVSIYEDAGDWRKPRASDLAQLNGWTGWKPFWGKIVTLPTTRRILIKFGLWNTHGTLWADRIQLAEITLDNPESVKPQWCRAGK